MIRKGTVTQNALGRGGADAATTIMGLPFEAATEAQCVGTIIDSLARGRGGWTVTVNLDILRRWRVDARFRSLVESVDMVVADGMPLIWASRLAGSALPERVAGSNLISSLSGAAAEAGLSIFLLGGERGSAVGASAALRRRFPSLRVVGEVCPPMGFEKDEAYVSELRLQLISARPDIVYVGLGSPKQEYFIECVRDALPSAWWMGVGASFSFISGHQKRAPRWAQRVGLEWAHRLAREPRRLSKRYLVDDLPFAGRLFAWAIGRRLGGPSRRSLSAGATQGSEAISRGWVDPTEEG